MRTTTHSYKVCLKKKGKKKVFFVLKTTLTLYKEDKVFILFTDNESFLKVQRGRIHTSLKKEIVLDKYSTIILWKRMIEGIFYDLIIVSENLYQIKHF